MGEPATRTTCHKPLRTYPDHFPPTLVQPCVAAVRPIAPPAARSALLALVSAMKVARFQPSAPLCPVPPTCHQGVVLVPSHPPWVIRPASTTSVTPALRQDFLRRRGRLESLALSPPRLPVCAKNFWGPPNFFCAGDKRLRRPMKRPRKKNRTDPAAHPSARPRFRRPRAALRLNQSAPTRPKRRNG